jgi:copper chaperone
MLFGRKKETLAVRGMVCSHCEKSVVDGVGEMDGVTKVKANADADRVEVFYKGDMPDMASIKSKIVELGYEVV